MEKVIAYKRTQFPALPRLIMQNEAKLGQAGVSGGLCVGSLIVQNEANSSIADFGLRIGNRPAAGRRRGCLTGSAGGYRLVGQRGSALGDTCNRHGKGES